MPLRTPHSHGHYKTVTRKGNKCKGCINYGQRWGGTSRRTSYFSCWGQTVYRRSHDSGCTAMYQRIRASPRATFCNRDINERMLRAHVFNMGRNMNEQGNPYRVVHKCGSFALSCGSRRVVHEITMISQICSYKEPMETICIMQWHEHLHTFAERNIYD